MLLFCFASLFLFRLTSVRLGKRFSMQQPLSIVATTVVWVYFCLFFFLLSFINIFFFWSIRIPERESTMSLIEKNNTLQSQKKLCGKKQVPMKYTHSKQFFFDKERKKDRHKKAAAAATTEKKCMCRRRKKNTCRRWKKVPKALSE